MAVLDHDATIFSVNAKEPRLTMRREDGQSIAIQQCGSCTICLLQ